MFKKALSLLLSMMLVVTSLVVTVVSVNAAGDTYLVAGSENLTGYTWVGVAADAPENVMTENGDGNYEKVFTDVAVGNGYQFKIVKNDTEWFGIGDTGNDNFTFNVTKKPGHDKLTLNAILNQRSQDILAANNWNVVQYAALLMMFAQVSGFEPGELVHVIADAHIYDRHIPIIKELIKRPTYPAPKVTLNPEVKDFYKFTVDDFMIEDYQAGPQIKNIPIAI